MTQPNKYIHHKLGREAIIDDKGLYTVKQMTTNYTHLSLYSEEQLLALGFQPVEKEKDWIDDVFNYLNTLEEPGLGRNLDSVEKKDIREAIERCMPKQELIPLDVEEIGSKIWDYIVANRHRLYEDRDMPEKGPIELKHILSKYGTTPQKKFTKEDIYKVVGSPIERDSFQAGRSQGAEEILKHLGLLQE